MVEVCRIAVIGAGTAGLAVATMLSRDGHDVTLFEAFETPKPLGAGLLLQPTGLACLAAMGLADQAKACAARIDHLHGMTNRGRTVFDISYETLVPNLFGLGIHRGVLFSLLYDAARSANIRMVTGKSVTATHLTADKRELHDAEGNSLGEFDLVIDASGRNADLCSAELGRRRKPFRYGAVWSVIEGDALDLSRHCLHQRYETAQKMMGLLPLGRGSDGKPDQWAFFWSLTRNDLSEWGDEGFARMKKEAAALWPGAADALQRFKGPEQFAIATYDQVTVRKPYTERFVVIGDAAHCTSPQLGQGANLALADAMELGLGLRAFPSVEAALMAYWQSRRGASRFYQLASWLLTPFFQSDSRMAARFRDAVLHPLSKVYFFDKQMVRTLSGVKTGPLSSLDPGRWSASYGLQTYGVTCAK